MKKESGITLVILSITVIVLFVLAGVCLTIILGDNGIIAKTQRKKEQTEEKALIEMVESAKTTAKIGSDSSTGNNITVLEKELINNLGNEIIIEKIGKDDDLPWIVKKDGYEIYIDENTIKTDGIVLNKLSLELVSGETETLIARILNEENRNIEWESSNTNVVTVIDGKINAVGEGNAQITAMIEGTKYEVNCLVNVK